MMCKAREALETYFSLCGLCGVQHDALCGHWKEDQCEASYECSDRCKRGRDALKAHDCIPRKVAEQAQRALQDKLPSNPWITSGVGVWVECAECGRVGGRIEAVNHAEGCPLVALAALTEALERSK